MPAPEDSTGVRAWLSLWASFTLTATLDLTLFRSHASFGSTHVKRHADQSATGALNAALACSESVSIASNAGLLGVSAEVAAISRDTNSIVVFRDHTTVASKLIDAQCSW